MEAFRALFGWRQGDRQIWRSVPTAALESGQRLEQTYDVLGQFFGRGAGANRTSTFPWRFFWWPTLEKNTREFLAACEVSARGKAQYQSPAGLLQPQPIPGRPWSHITLDFVTGLPPPKGNMVIVTVVDRFFKTAHILALPKLPTALETTNLLVDQVFRLHGTPSNIIPNRGPNLHHKFGGLLPRPWKLPSPPTNQDLESALCCVAATHPSSWRTHFPWVEHVRNTLTSSVTGLSPFEASLGYQPPLSFQEIAVPPVQEFFQRAQEAARP